MESRGEPPPLIWTVRSKSNLTAVHKQCSIRKLTLSLSRSVRYFRYLPLFHLSLSLYLARFLISRDFDRCSPSRFLSISYTISLHPRAESSFVSLTSSLSVDWSYRIWRFRQIKLCFARIKLSFPQIKLIFAKLLTFNHHQVWINRSTLCINNTEISFWR